MKIKKVFTIIGILISGIFYSQSIPTHEIIEVKNLQKYLTNEALEQLGAKGPSTEELAQYFRQKFSERYFYDWKTFEQRFEQYNNWYPQIKASHQERGLDHVSKYNASTSWKLPFNYLNGQAVNAYALRHLARQHKMVDNAYNYFYEDKNPKHIAYFTGQMKSLNEALVKGDYERIEDGNGVYEAFRSGYRVLNWLRIHNMYLAAPEYSDDDQLITIATLLQHGAHLYANNQKFHAGNHQTRGLSALAMIAILLRDFKGTDIWYKKAMELLEEHLRKEINDDDFQFERTVHYHKSDIGNFYYVYQLAKISELPVAEFWTSKLKGLFTTLTKIAFPDKTAPVLQDDTEAPWGEYNNISDALTLGYLLFEDPEMGYFADEVVGKNMYWYLNAHQLSLLNNVQKKQPEYKSLSFPTTGLFVTREGWGKDDKVMIITAGLDEHKPDHQHGDMLGVQAYANEKVILPNYQVRYSLKDLELFKNSMVKNVALVDDELQGKEYTSNKGGSGFGKFRKLPNPTVIYWDTNDSFDFFAGSHDGFEDVGVAYSRQVINVMNDFWVVKDNFESDNAHIYKQVWQGHFTKEHAPELLRSSFDNGSGFDILQLGTTDSFTSGGSRGKEWSVLHKKGVKKYSFVTILYPYDNFENRLNEEENFSKIGTWETESSLWNASGSNLIMLSQGNHALLFSVESIVREKTQIEFSTAADLTIFDSEKVLEIRSLSDKEISFEITYDSKSINRQERIKLNPGSTISYYKTGNELVRKL